MRFGLSFIAIALSLALPATIAPHVAQAQVAECLSIFEAVPPPPQKEITLADLLGLRSQTDEIRPNGKPVNYFDELLQQSLILFDQSLEISDGRDVSATKQLIVDRNWLKENTPKEKWNEQLADLVLKMGMKLSFENLRALVPVAIGRQEAAIKNIQKLQGMKARHPEKAANIDVLINEQQWEIVKIQDILEAHGKIYFFLFEHAECIAFCEAKPVELQRTARMVLRQTGFFDPMVQATIPQVDAAFNRRLKELGLDGLGETFNHFTEFANAVIQFGEKYQDTDRYFLSQLKIETEHRRTVDQLPLLPHQQAILDGKIPEEWLAEQRRKAGIADAPAELDPEMARLKEIADILTTHGMMKLSIDPSRGGDVVHYMTLARQLKLQQQQRIWAWGGNGRFLIFTLNMLRKTVPAFQMLEKAGMLDWIIGKFRDSMLLRTYGYGLVKIHRIRGADATTKLRRINSMRTSGQFSDYYGTEIFETCARMLPQLWAEIYAEAFKDPNNVEWANVRAIMAPIHEQFSAGKLAPLPLDFNPDPRNAIFYGVVFSAVTYGVHYMGWDMAALEKLSAYPPELLLALPPTVIAAKLKFK